MNHVTTRLFRSTAFLLAAASVVAAPAVLTAQGMAVGGRPVTVSGVRGTSILGSAWNADNSPIPGAHLRLRNVGSGKIESVAIANNVGQFTFPGINAGTYAVELVTDGGHVVAVGQVFTVGSGETVATFVRLGAKVPWFTGFFSNAAAAAALTAASEGITALAPVARPVSANR